MDIGHGAEGYLEGSCKGGLYIGLARMSKGKYSIGIQKEFIYFNLISNKIHFLPSGLNRHCRHLGNAIALLIFLMVCTNPMHIYHLLLSVR